MLQARFVRFFFDDNIIRFQMKLKVVVSVLLDLFVVCLTLNSVSSIIPFFLANSRFLSLFTSPFSSLICFKRSASSFSWFFFMVSSRYSSDVITLSFRITLGVFLFSVTYDSNPATRVWILQMILCNWVILLIDQSREVALLVISMENV